MVGRKTDSGCEVRYLACQLKPGHDGMEVIGQSD